VYSHSVIRDRAAECADGDVELTILMPCLNEAETLAICIDKARAFLARSGINGEVIVADNGSTDGSQSIAADHGAYVVTVAERGYGVALMAGIRAARGRYVIMGDSDDSYDFSRLELFVDALRRGNDLVMGNRFAGGIAPGAMPPLHRYVGNPLLTGIGRLFFQSPARDFHCGMRGFVKSKMEALDLRTTGMEFASEMVVKSALHGLAVAEVPTTLSPDGRSRPPHLRSWRDGWRHLRFLLTYAPRWLFLYPGFLMLFVGLVVMAAVLPGPLRMGSVMFDVHTLIVALAAILVGSNTIIFFLIAKQFSTNERLVPEGKRFRAYRTHIKAEELIVGGAALALLGIIGLVLAVHQWGMAEFGVLEYTWMMRLVIPSVGALSVGVQVLLGGFLSAILDTKLR
jgi:glycosyltransferase involved in cell wall biosynthesis